MPINNVTCFYSILYIYYIVRLKCLLIFPYNLFHFTQSVHNKTITRSMNLQIIKQICTKLWSADTSHSAAVYVPYAMEFRWFEFFLDHFLSNSLVKIIVIDPYSCGLRPFRLALQTNFLPSFTSATSQNKISASENNLCKFSSPWNCLYCGQIRDISEAVKNLSIREDCIWGRNDCLCNRDDYLCKPIVFARLWERVDCLCNKNSMPLL